MLDNNSNDIKIKKNPQTEIVSKDTANNENIIDSEISKIIEKNTINVENNSTEVKEGVDFKNSANSKQNLEQKAEQNESEIKDQYFKVKNFQKQIREEINKMKSEMTYMLEKNISKEKSKQKKNKIIGEPIDVLKSYEDYCKSNRYEVLKNWDIKKFEDIKNNLKSGMKYYNETEKMLEKIETDWGDPIYKLRKIYDDWSSKEEFSAYKEETELIFSEASRVYVDLKNLKMRFFFESLFEKNLNLESLFFPFKETLKAGIVIKRKGKNDIRWYVYDGKDKFTPNLKEKQQEKDYLNEGMHEKGGLTELFKDKFLLFPYEGNLDILVPSWGENQNSNEEDINEKEADEKNVILENDKEKKEKEYFIKAIPVVGGFGVERMFLQNMPDKIEEEIRLKEDMTQEEKKAFYDAVPACFMDVVEKKLIVTPKMFLDSSKKNFDYKKFLDLFTELEISNINGIDFSGVCEKYKKSLENNLDGANKISKLSNGDKKILRRVQDSMFSNINMLVLDLPAYAALTRWKAEEVNKQGSKLLSFKEFSDQAFQPNKNYMALFKDESGDFKAKKFYFYKNKISKGLEKLLRIKKVKRALETLTDDRLEFKRGYDSDENCDDSKICCRCALNRFISNNKDKLDDMPSIAFELNEKAQKVYSWLEKTLEEEKNKEIKIGENEGCGDLFEMMFRMFKDLNSIAFICERDVLLIVYRDLKCESNNLADQIKIFFRAYGMHGVFDSIDMKPSVVYKKNIATYLKTIKDLCHEKVKKSSVKI